VIFTHLYFFSNEKEGGVLGEFSSLPGSGAVFAGGYGQMDG